MRHLLQHPPREEGVVLCSTTAHPCAYPTLQFTCLWRGYPILLLILHLGLIFSDWI